MGKYQAYPEYKSSGVNWLGEIPKEWAVVRQKNIFSILSGYAFKSEYFQKEPANFPALVTPGSFHQNGGLYFGEKNTHYYNGVVQSEYLLQKDDLLIVMTDLSYKKLILGNCEVVDKDNVLLNQRVGKIIFNGNTRFEINKRYIQYSINSEGAREQVILTSTGATVFHSSPEKIGNVYTLLPCVDEQQQIANFLDHETAKIDTLIEKQQQLIALLKEKRQAVISHAVTKGLNANAPMRNSGVEWLGEVPEHWDVMYIKHLSTVKRGASPRPIDDQRYFDDNGDYAWVRIADVSKSGMYLTSTIQRLSALGASLSVKLEADQLFVSIAGTVGKPCLTISKACIHDGFVYFPELKINNKFLYYIFEAGEAYLGLGKMGTQLNLNTESVGGIKVGLPPNNEIEVIISFIEETNVKYDALINKANQSINLMQERRTALISAAVTGKIDVRNWQSPEQQESVQ